MKKCVFLTVMVLISICIDGRVTAGVIEQTCLEYSAETVCYPAAWTYLPGPDPGLLGSRQTVFTLNSDYTGILKFDKDGNAARNWAYAGISVPSWVPDDTSDDEIIKRLKWRPCTDKDPIGCYAILRNRQINGIRMHFYEIHRFRRGESEIKSIYVFFRAQGKPYWFTFSAHRLDFDRFWPYFETIVGSFRVRRGLN